MGKNSSGFYIFSLTGETRLYLSVKYPVNELHIEAAAYGVGKLIVLGFLIGFGVEGAEGTGIGALSFAERAEHGFGEMTAGSAPLLPMWIS